MTMDYSTLRDLLQRHHAEILSVRREVMGYGAELTVLVDGKQQYKTHVSGAQLLALDLKAETG